MEEEKTRTTEYKEEGPHSREVVEVYRGNWSREVVECYRRPLPGDEPQPKTPQKHKKPKKGLWVFLLLLLIVLALALGAWIWSVAFPKGDEAKPELPQELLPQKTAEIEIPRYPYGEGAKLQVQRERGENKSPQEIYAGLNPAVVMVMAQLDRGVSLGTGVIFTEDGYILTNYHVVEGGLDCMVMLDNGYTFPALYVAGDRLNDLAILKTEAPALPTADFGDSDELVVGDTVYAIGNPLGMELRGTFTNGIVSAIDRDVQVEIGRAHV